MAEHGNRTELTTNELVHVWPILNILVEEKNNGGYRNLVEMWKDLRMMSRYSRGESDQTLKDRLQPAGWRQVQVLKNIQALQVPTERIRRKMDESQYNLWLIQTILTEYSSAIFTYIGDPRKRD